MRRLVNDLKINQKNLIYSAVQEQRKHSLQYILLLSTVNTETGEGQ